MKEIQITITKTIEVTESVDEKEDIEYLKKKMSEDIEFNINNALKHYGYIEFK